MSETFYLRVLSAEKTFFSGKAKSLTVQTQDGRLQFLAHHEQMIAGLDAGQIEIVPENGEKLSAVAGFGSMVFANNRAEVLVETCETREELDLRRAQEHLERAQEQMLHKQSMAEYHLSQASMARALSRLRYKGQSADTH